MTQQSSDMVERVAREIREHAIMTLPDARYAVMKTLEASHHAELVDCLYLALDCLQVGDPEREHLRTQEAINKAKVLLKGLPRRAGWDVQYAKRPDGSLCEIGGDA